MWWACVLLASNPTQHMGHAWASSFKLSLQCTHTCCPHSGTPARLGFRPVSFSCGVMSPSTLVVVQFFTQMMKFMASAQSDFSSPDWIRHAQMRSMMHQLSDSATPLCCGVLCMVSLCSIPCSMRNLVNSLPVYSPPWSNHNRLICMLCCVYIHMAYALYASSVSSFMQSMVSDE